MTGKRRKTQNSNKNEVVEIKIEDDDDSYYKNNVTMEDNSKEKEDNDCKNNVTMEDNKKEKENKDEENGCNNKKKEDDEYVWSKHRYMTCIKKSMLKFKCDQCDYASTTKGNLRSHMFTHTSDFPFPCPYCPYKGKRHTYLKKHMLHKHYSLINMNILRTPDDDYYKS